MTGVAIVGGGLAGLTCAFALKERGIPATVFEASVTAGGRATAAVYLLGPAIYTNTFRLAESLGLQRELIEIPPISGQYYKGRVYHHRVSSVTGLLNFKGLNIADKAMLSRMAYFLVRYSAKLDFHHPEHGATLDDETTAAFVKRELSQNILNYVAGPLISSLFYYSSEETSKLLYLLLAKHMYNTRMHTLRGGLDRLPESLCARVTVRRGNAVHSITHDGAAYLVNGESFSEVVIAVPGNSVLGIRGMKDLLDTDDIQFFDSCAYGRALNVTLDVEAPVDRCYALSIPRVERLAANTVVFHDFIDPGNAADGSRVTIIGGGESVTAENLIDDFTRIYQVRQTGVRQREWLSAMPKFPPGRYRELSAFLSRDRRPGLVFCGDYLMGPFVEAAIATGRRAAEAIMKTSGA